MYMCEYWHPKFYLVKELIGILYNLDKCGSGGCCHIVTDDSNIYDRDLDFVIEECDKEENKDRIDKELSKTICLILKEMTFEQRAMLFRVLNSDLELKKKEDIDFCLSWSKCVPEDIYREADWDNLFY